MGQTVTRCYRVEGMVCSACQAAVERATMRLPQVTSAHASASEGTLEVTYVAGVDANAVEDALIQAVFDSGYEVVGKARAEKSQPAGETGHAGTSQSPGFATRFGSSQPAVNAAYPRASQPTGSAACAGVSQPAKPIAQAGASQLAGSAIKTGASQSAGPAARAGFSQSARETAHPGVSQPTGSAARWGLAGRKASCTGRGIAGE